jgi:two-component system chemotaxis response regulator CheY
MESLEIGKGRFAVTSPRYAALPKSTKILLVEDSNLQAKVLLKIFEELGYKNVLYCEHPEKALETAKAEQSKVIFCDWNMPTMSGLDVLKLMRADEELKKVPFIFLTADSDRTKVIEAVKNGANDYIVKPATAPTIDEKLRKAGGLEIPSSS